MNIFFLAYCARLCAREQCDTHVIKMILETMQMLCTALHCCATPIVFPCALYRPVHVNHPSSKWVRHSIEHFEWMIEHGMALCEEYTRRYGKRHKCHDMYLALKPIRPTFQKQDFTDYLSKIAKADIPHGLKFIVVAISDDVFDEYAAYRDGELLGVQTYRNYYESKKTTMKRKMTWREPAEEAARAD